MPAILDRCVKNVMAQQKKKGKDEKEAKSSAFAICTATMKKAGKLSEEEIEKIFTEFQSKEFENDEEVSKWLEEKVEEAIQMGIKKNEERRETGRKYRSISDVIKLESSEGGEGKGIKVHMIRTGAWEHPLYGLFRVTPATLESFVKNFEANIPQEHIAFDFRHQPDLGAAAWVTSLEVKDNYLVGKVDLTDEGIKALKSGRFRYFSTEYSENYKDAESGSECGATILGGGLTNRPFIKGMPPVMLSEDGEKKEVETILVEVLEDMDKVKELEGRITELEAALKALKELKEAEGDKARLTQLEAEVVEAQKNLEDTKKELEEAKKELAAKKDDKKEDKKDGNKKFEDELAALREENKKLADQNVVMAKTLEDIGKEHKANKKELHVTKVESFVLESVKAGIPPAVMAVAKPFLLAEFDVPTVIKLSEEGKDVSYGLLDIMKKMLEAFPKENRIDFSEESHSPRGDQKFEDQDSKILEEADHIMEKAKKEGVVISYKDAVLDAAKKRQSK